MSHDFVRLDDGRAACSCGWESAAYSSGWDAGEAWGRHRQAHVGDHPAARHRRRGAGGR